jgi:hypothetical protein
MHGRGLSAIGILIVIALGASIPAAEPEPGERWAVGGALGLIKPVGSDEFDLEPSALGFAEYLQGDSIAWRGSVVWIEFDAPEGSLVGGIGVLAFLANFAYRWDADSVHPILTAGVGLYDYDPEVGDGAREFGLNLGGGVEIELRPRLGIILEASLHGTSADEPDTFFLASVGARWRF